MSPLKNFGITHPKIYLLHAKGTVYLYPALRIAKLTLPCPLCLSISLFTFLKFVLIQLLLVSVFL